MTSKSELKRLAVQCPEVQELIEKNARLREVLALIKLHDGMTLLGPCCPHPTGEPCLHQKGAALAFSECASEARAALEGKE